MMTLDTMWINRVVVRMMNELEAQLKAARMTEFLSLNQAEIEKGIRFLLLFLRESILFDQPAIFLDNVAWYRRNHLNRSLPPFLLEQTIGMLKAILDEEGDPAFRSQAIPLLNRALARMSEGVSAQTAYLDQPGVDTAACNAFLGSLLTFNPEPSKRLVAAMLSQDPDRRRVYNRLFQPVLYETGRLWQTGEISVAQEHYVTETTRTIMDSILSSTEHIRETGHTFMGLCPENEQHSVGIRMVCDHFTLGGWHSFFLGGNVPCRGIIDVLKMKQVDLVGISVSMPYNIHKAAESIACMRNHLQRECPHILVGGIAFNEYPDVWVKVGADAYTRTAEEALAKGMALMNPVADRER
jgi:MerR family transcriptional regulator, light-induced transcriptional regulator